MKRGLFISIFLSSFLIVAALYFRFLYVAKSAPTADLAYVYSDQNNVADSTTADTNTSNRAIALPSTPTDTDTLGKKLFSDYVSLSVNGSDSTENVAALADKYAEDIAMINKANKINGADLSVVENTKLNFQSYADQFSILYTKYQVLINKEYYSHENLDSESADLHAFSANLGDIYKQETDELKKIKVPKALLETHLDLINNYLSYSWAMKALSKEETDPTSAYAGMVAYKQNVEDEEIILGNIEKILTDNGI